MDLNGWEMIIISFLGYRWGYDVVKTYLSKIEHEMIGGVLGDTIWYGSIYFVLMKAGLFV